MAIKCDIFRHKEAVAHYSETKGVEMISEGVGHCCVLGKAIYTIVCVLIIDDMALKHVW